MGKAELDTWPQTTTCVMRWSSARLENDPGYIAVKQKHLGREGWSEGGMESTLVQQDMGFWALQAVDRCQSPSLGVLGQGFCLWSTRQISTPALRPSSGLLTQKAKTRSQKEPANFVLP